MNGQVLKSGATIVAGMVVAAIGIAVFPIVLLLVIGKLSPRYAESHVAVAAALSCAVVTIIAGATIGVLAPARPIAHAAVVAVIVSSIGVMLGGKAALPNGWEIAVHIALARPPFLAIQLALMGGVAELVFRRRRQVAFA